MYNTIMVYAILFNIRSTEDVRLSAEFTAAAAYHTNECNYQNFRNIQ